MSGKTEQAKGRAKEAAGVLVGDKRLEREGKVDRAAGRVKEKAGEVVDKVKSTFKRRRSGRESRMRAQIVAVAIGVVAMSMVVRAVDAADARPPAVRLAENQDQPAADNSGKNVRDRDDRALTPVDQGGNESDRSITQEIRKAVVADDGLSMNAKNVKIITIDGVVTLRGPVKSADEKAKIASVSAKAAGVKRVDNQLEVEAQR
jgi:uncharacterized protein YjbJ (UPF0337 family)